VQRARDLAAIRLAAQARVPLRNLVCGALTTNMRAARHHRDGSVQERDSCVASDN